MIIAGITITYGVVMISIPTEQPVKVPTVEATDIQQDSDLYSNGEIDQRFNELRRELLDDRASTIDWWLIGITVFLGLFTILVALVGIAGYLEFRRVREQALEAVRQAQESAEEAKHFVEEIKQIRDEAHEYLQDVTAKKVDDDPGAKRQAEVVSNDPEASLMDRAVARAIALQKGGKIEEAIKTWRGIADAITGIDNDLAARAWISIGYLEGERGDKSNPEEVFSAYDEAIHLKPDYADAYVLRGHAKGKLDRGEDAVVDYNEAIRLKSDYVEAYVLRGIAKTELDQWEDAIIDFDEVINLKSDYAEIYVLRGHAKVKMGRMAEARTDFEKALDIAKKAGDEETVSKVGENLQELEDSEST